MLPLQLTRPSHFITFEKHRLSPPLTSMDVLLPDAGGVPLQGKGIDVLAG